MAIDCNLTLAGLQDFCTFTPGTAVDVGVLFENGPAVKLGAFRFSVHDPDTSRLQPLAPPGGYLDANPDFNDELPGDDWLCLPPAEHASNDDGPGTAVSRIDCFQDHHSRDEVTELAAGGQTMMAIVHYMVPAGASEGSVALGLSHTHVRDGTLAEIGSCAPRLETDIACLGATINIEYPVCPAPDVDCDSFDDAIPVSHQGPANTDGTVDNCIGVPNPGQENADGNFIDAAPPLLVDDTSRAMSDAAGDACDDDDDNDGLIDADETSLPGAACPSATGALDPLNQDTDGDAAIDGAECAIGTNPNDPLIRPTAEQCRVLAGAPLTTTDTDGDRIADIVEVCGYGTSPSLLESDGDGWYDGCEAGSINSDSIKPLVNSGDQLQLATAILLDLSGPFVLAADLNKDGRNNSGDQLLMAQLILGANCASQPP